MKKDRFWKFGWWEETFAHTRNFSEIQGHAKGVPKMLIVVAYDIRKPKRLKKVADCCKDFGIRVQYSVFECRLDADLFDRFWERICSIADPTEDRLVAYPLHGAESRKIRTYGQMVCNEAVVSYIF